MNRPTHTLNPNTGREIQINGVRFWNLLKHGFKYDEKLNRLYDKPLPEGTTKYVPKSRMLSSTNRPLIIGGTAHNELIRDNYRRVKGQWVKMTKEQAKAYDNDPDINKIFADPVSDDSESSESEYIELMSSSTTRMAMRFSHSRGCRQCSQLIHFGHACIITYYFVTLI